MYRTEVHIKGRLDANWSEWFEGMKIQSTTNGDTILSGNLPDKVSNLWGFIEIEQSGCRSHLPDV